MKIKQAIPALLAASFIFAGQINSANAYFTTYVTAKGGYELSWKHEEHIKEEMSGWDKYVTISSAEDSIPVFVRARAFAGSKHPLTYNPGSAWTANEDGYYYYNTALYGGETTAALVVSIQEPEAARLGDNFNVVVVYESIPAEFSADGVPVNPATCVWENPLGTVQENNDAWLTTVGGTGNE